MQGAKCMGYILQLCNNLSLNTKKKLDVFDTYVSSVLNYGCEVWGFLPANDVEKVHMDFCSSSLEVVKDLTCIFRPSVFVMGTSSYLS